MSANASLVCAGVEVGVTANGNQPILEVQAAQPLPVAEAAQVAQAVEPIQEVTEVVAQQANFVADISRCPISGDCPELVRDLQRKAVMVLESHKFERERVEELSRIISDSLRSQEAPEHDDVAWSEHITAFVNQLRVVADQHGMDADVATRILRSMGLNINSILVCCLVVYLQLNDNEGKRECLRHILSGVYQQHLQEAFFGEKFHQLVTTPQHDIQKFDGSSLSGEEQEMLGKFLSNVISELRLTVWVNLEKMIQLADGKDLSMELPIIVAVEGKKMTKRGSLRVLPDLKSLESDVAGMLSSTIGRIPQLAVFAGSSRRLLSTQASQETKEINQVADTRPLEQIIMSAAGVVEDEQVKTYVKKLMTTLGHIVGHEKVIRNEDGDSPRKSG